MSRAERRTYIDRFAGWCQNLPTAFQFKPRDFRTLEVEEEAAQEADDPQSEGEEEAGQGAANTDSEADEDASEEAAGTDSEEVGVAADHTSESQDTYFGGEQSNPDDDEVEDTIVIATEDTHGKEAESSMNDASEHPDSNMGNKHPKPPSNTIHDAMVSKGGNQVRKDGAPQRPAPQDLALAKATPKHTLVKGPELGKEDHGTSFPSRLPGLLLGGATGGSSNLGQNSDGSPSPNLSPGLNREVARGDSASNPMLQPFNDSAISLSLDDEHSPDRSTSGPRCAATTSVLSQTRKRKTSVAAASAATSPRPAKTQRVDVSVKMPAPAAPAAITAEPPLSRADIIQGMSHALGGLDTLAGNNWVDDSAVNAIVPYFAIAATRSGRNLAVANSQTLQWWARQAADKHRAPATSRRELKMRNAAEILLPLHVNGNHWVAVQYTMSENTAVVFDSLPTARATLQSIEVTVTKALRYLKGDPALHIQVTMGHTKMRQNDATECGVLMLANLACLCGLPLSDKHDLRALFRTQLLFPQVPIIHDCHDMFRTRFTTSTDPYDEAFQSRSPARLAGLIAGLRAAKEAQDRAADEVRLRAQTYAEVFDEFRLEPFRLALASVTALRRCALGSASLGTAAGLLDAGTLQVAQVAARHAANQLTNRAVWLSYDPRALRLVFERGTAASVGRYRDAAARYQELRRRVDEVVGALARVERERDAILARVADDEA